MTGRLRSHPTIDPQRAARSRRVAVRAFVGAAAAALVAMVGAFTAGFGSLSSADLLLAQPPPSDTMLYDRTGQVMLADLHPPGYQNYEVPLSAMGKGDERLTPPGDLDMKWVDGMPAWFLPGTSADTSPRPLPNGVSVGSG